VTQPTPPALLIAGHGTADEKGAEQFRAFADRVGKRLASRGVTVEGGFIELSPPPLGDAVAALVDSGHRRIAAVPLMLVAAGHAKGDIPAALAREKQRHPGLSVAYGRALGPHPVLLALLRRRLAGVLTPDEYAETTVLLVGRGSTDPDANAEVAKIARLLAETAAVAGVEYAFVSLAPPGVPAGLDRCAALGARRIVVLPYFLFTGILPDRVTTQAYAWAAARPDIEVRCADVLGDTDELADLVVERYDEALRGDIRMNCDTCVYRIQLPGFEAKTGAPQLPHHHPDDPAHQHQHDHHGGTHHHSPERANPAAFDEATRFLAS
jgi:sirohydrochlorin cobaltochelatase